MVVPRMKTSLEHLPEDKRALLARAVATIRAEVPEAGIIILFGSHARGDWTHNPKTGYRSDYDLLVIVDGEEIAQNVTLWDRVHDAIKGHTTTASVDIIAHDFREVNQQIRRGQFFFVEIWQQGIVLWDARRFALARPKAATPEERRELSREYFDHWFTSASRFLSYSQDGAARGWTSEAAFVLHQSAERYFAAALLVITGTKPTTHDLRKLVELVSPLHPLLAEPFPMGTEELSNHGGGALRARGPREGLGRPDRAGVQGEDRGSGIAEADGPQGRAGRTGHDVHLLEILA